MPCMSCVFVYCPLLRFTFAGLRLHDGHDEVVLGHEVVLGDERREAVAQVRLVLELVEYPPVVEVGVREDPVDAPTHRPQLRHRRVLDGHATRKVFVAVQQARRPIQRVSRVVDGRTLLRSLVGRTQEDPLLRGDHLVARAGEALRLQPHRQSIELHAELSGREKGGEVNEERILHVLLSKFAIAIEVSDESKVALAHQKNHLSICVIAPVSSSAAEPT